MIRKVYAVISYEQLRFPYFLRFDLVLGMGEICFLLCMESEMVLDSLPVYFCAFALLVVRGLHCAE